MKKIFLSLIATALLFSACGNDNDEVQTGDTGSLSGTIIFQGLDETEKAFTVSTAIPITSWANVNTMRMFLYNTADGTVAYSKEILKSNVQGGNAFNIEGIPAGTYKLALVANVKSSSDPVSTTVDAWTGTAEFDDSNVKSKKMNTQIGIDFKKAANLSGVPTEFQGFSLTHVTPSEIFVAYADNVVISSTTKAVVNGLALERIVSLMRIRVKVAIPETYLEFNNPANSMVVYNTPEQINLAVGATKSGSTEKSNPARILVGVKGATTYLTTDPLTATHTDKNGNQGKVINTTEGIKYWNEFIVFPNTTDPTKTVADKGRKYNIVLSAWAKTGHILGNLEKVTTPTLVYWQGDIEETFTPNKIREVNVTIKTGGTPIVPPGPGEKGDLDIQCSDPLPWNSAIDQSEIDL